MTTPNKLKSLITRYEITTREIENEMMQCGPDKIRYEKLKAMYKQSRDAQQSLQVELYHMEKNLNR